MALNFTKKFDIAGNNGFFSPIESLQAVFGGDGDDTFYSFATGTTFKDGSYWNLPSFLAGGTGNDKYNVGPNDAVIILDSGSSADHLRIYESLSNVRLFARVDGRHLITVIQGYNPTWIFGVDAFRPSGSIEKTEFSGSVFLDTSWNSLPSLVASAGVPFEDLTWNQAISKKYINLSVLGVSNDSAGASQLISEAYRDSLMAPESTIAITTSSISLNEGETLVTTVVTTKVASATMIYWSIAGDGINSADFKSVALTGSDVVGTDGKFSFAHTAANDLTTEGDETLQIKLFADSARTAQVGSTATVTLKDTSLTPAPTYVLTSSATSINEGGTLTTSISTTGVTSGATLYYALSGTGITSADFSSGTLTGSGMVGTDGKFSFAHTTANDLTTEGDETLQIKLFSDLAKTAQVGTTANVTLKDTSLTPVKPTQKVYTEKPQITYKPTSTISAPLLYTTSSGDANLSGLTLDVHYNSSILTPTGANNGVSSQVSAAITSTAILADTNNTDGDPLTDNIIQLVWGTFDNSFPSKTLPASLATVSFNTAATKKDPLTGQPLTMTVRYTASETAAGYDFITSFTTFKAQSFNLDVDGDGKVTALGDGLMVIRKLFGAAFAGDALTYKAMSPNATRTTAEISDFIQQGIDDGMLDVDKDGKTSALGDGLMVIRRLFGAAFDGAALTNKAISPNSPYFGQANDINSVGINVDALKPVMPLI